jgi:hypothetical protein
MNYKSSQQVWMKHFPGALIVMALTFVFFNTIQWTEMVPSEAWPYGTSIATLFAYLVGQVLDPKVAIFVSTIAAIVILVLAAMKVRPILKSAFSPSYKFDTIIVMVLFVGVFVALPMLGYWAFADRVVTNPHVYINTLLPTIVGSIYFAGKTHAAAQFAETRTRATDAVEEDVFEEA